jgi:hypothetical protein
MIWRNARTPTGVSNQIRVKRERKRLEQMIVSNPSNITTLIVMIKETSTG